MVARNKTGWNCGVTIYWSTGVLEYWEKTESIRSGGQNKKSEHMIRKLGQIEFVIAA